jgi:hypothetical protein
MSLLLWIERLSNLESRPTVGFTCRRDKQDSTAYQPRNLCKLPPHTHAEGGQVQTVLGAHPCWSKTPMPASAFFSTGKVRMILPHSMIFIAQRQAMCNSLNIL